MGISLEAMKITRDMMVRDKLSSIPVSGDSGIERLTLPQVEAMIAKAKS